MKSVTMTSWNDGEEARSRRWPSRLRRTRLLLAAAVAVFAGLWATGALAGVPAARVLKRIVSMP